MENSTYYSRTPPALCPPPSPLSTTDTMKHTHTHVHHRKTPIGKPKASTALWSLIPSTQGIHVPVCMLGFTRRCTHSQHHAHVSLHTAHMHMHSALAQILAVRVNPPPEHCLCSPSVAASGACGVMMRQLLTQTQISAARQRPKCNCQNCRCSRSLQSC